MSKPPPPDSPLTRPQKIAKLEAMYLHRFVDTPLSFWDDGSTTKKEKDDYYIQGLIYGFRLPRRKSLPVVAQIHYAPTKNEPDFQCDIELDIAIKMMHDADFKCLPGTFFYEESDLFFRIQTYYYYTHTYIYTYIYIYIYIY